LRCKSSPIIGDCVRESAVGGVGLELQTDVNRSAPKLATGSGRALGQGVGSEAVRLATQWAMTAHGLLRIYAQPFADNLASRRVLERAGYAFEGLCSAVRSRMERCGSVSLCPLERNCKFHVGFMAASLPSSS